MRYTILVKRKKPSTASPGPSGAASAAVSRRSTPADKSTPEILILHPETYHSRSSTGTPVATSASTPTPAPTSQARPKPKPKPRARRKQPTVPAEDTVSQSTSDPSPALGPTLIGQAEQPHEEQAERHTPSESSAAGAERQVGDADREDVRPSKRRRTAAPSSVSAVEAPSTEQEPAQEIVASEDASVDAQGAQAEEVVESEKESTPTTSGRGKGKGKGRGRGRGRGMGRSGPSRRKSALEQDEQTSTASKFSQPSESGPSTGALSSNKPAVPTPTRRQPHRAVNKASRKDSPG